MKIMKYTIYTVSVIFWAWFLFSWYDVVAHPGAQVAWNFFSVVFR